MHHSATTSENEVAMVTVPFCTAKCWYGNTNLIIWRTLLQGVPVSACYLSLLFSTCSKLCLINSNHHHQQQQQQRFTFCISLRQKIQTNSHLKNLLSSLRVPTWLLKIVVCTQTQCKISDFSHMPLSEFSYASKFQRLIQP